MQLNEDDKLKTVLQLMDMFGTQSQETVRQVCEEHNWDVPHCVDRLIAQESATTIFPPTRATTTTTTTTVVNNDSENVLGATAAAAAATLASADSTQNLRWYSDKYQIQKHGAIPKMINNTNYFNNNNQSENKNQTTAKMAATAAAAATQQQNLNMSPYKQKNNNNNGNNTKHNNNTANVTPNRNNNCNNNANVNYQRICAQIEAGYRVLVLMRGVPGSGKSTLAESLLQDSATLNAQTKYKRHDFIFSTDDFFYGAGGRYNFDPQFLPEAHSRNHQRIRAKTRAGWSPIIVDNTNTQLWEMMPYVQAGVQNGYIIELLEPQTSWRNNANKLAMKNTHQVSRDSIQRALNRYEKATVNDLLGMLKDTRYTVPIPQMRRQPQIYAQVPKQTEPRQEQQQQPQQQIKIQTSSKTDEMQQETEQDLTYEQFTQIADLPLTSGNAAADATTEQAWSSYETKDAPKKQRTRSRNKIKAETAASSSNQSESSSNEAWQPFERAAPVFWGKQKQEETTLQKSNSKNLLELLRESLNEPQQNQNSNSNTNSSSNNSSSLLGGGNNSLTKTTAKTYYNNEDEPPEANSKIKRHSINCPNEAAGFISLRQVYPNKQVTGLWDLYVKCNGDVDWAVDILLKEDELGSNNDCDVTLTETNTYSDDFQCNCFKAPEPKPTITQQQQPQTQTSIIKPQRQTRAARRTNPELLEMQLQIENCFVLGDEQYSEHTRKIRDIRNGILDQPLPYPLPEINMANTNTETIDDADDDTPEDEEPTADAQQLLEFDLGDNLIAQLCNVFKKEHTLGERLPEKCATNVFLPRAFAKQLYMLWMEAVYNQMEEQRQQILHEDEQFARLLKNPKYSDVQESPHNVNELLDMELAWSIYNNEKERETVRLAELTKSNDIATHLTKMKLCEQFPEIPRETLLDVYTAHKQSYTKTLEALGGPRVEQQNLTQSGLIERAKRENELLNREAEQRQQQYANNADDATDLGERNNNNNVNAYNTNNNKKTIQMREEHKLLALHDFEETRNMAAHHSQLKAECYQKAKAAIQKGNGGAAIYYSEIANLHKKRIDMYNHRAANCIMQVHKYTQNNPDLLDLHYLHVLEAISCLDLFLDQHITALRAIFRPYKHVFIITGRGLHSAGGVSTIKNKVKGRLKERSLKWTDVNPGLLKVKIFSASRHSKNF